MAWGGEEAVEMLSLDEEVQLAVKEVALEKLEKWEAPRVPKSKTTSCKCSKCCSRKGGF